MSDWLGDVILILVWFFSQIRAYKQGQKDQHELNSYNFTAALEVYAGKRWARRFAIWWAQNGEDINRRVIR